VSQLIPLFKAFYGTYFGEAVTEAAVLRRLRQAEGHETVVVAEVGDRLAGFASVRVTPSLDQTPHAELTDLFVASEFRRAGVASQLVTHLEGIARERGATELVVLTWKSNAEGLAFYRAAGYEEDAVAMRKMLSPSENR
jgi:ribosomal protein S18 acetylase RimI-like enzyme